MPTPITVATLTIVDYAEKLGFLECNWSRSASSDSLYVTVINPLDDSTLKIRISDHVLPPSYSYLIGDANYECTPQEKNFHEMSQGTMIDAVVWLAKKINQPIPAPIKGAITRRDRRKTFSKEEMKIRQAADAKRIQEIEARETAALAWAKENNTEEHQAIIRIQKEDPLTKNRRSKLRKKLSKLRKVIVEKYSEQP